MAASVRKLGESPPKKQRPALTPEADENRMISLAIKQAEKQLMDGTASSQIVCHYLKLASSSERLEQQKTKRELELLEAKTEAIKAQKRMEELFSEAIEAMKGYRYDDGGVE